VLYEKLYFAVWLQFFRLKFFSPIHTGASKQVTGHTDDSPQTDPHTDHSPSSDDPFEGEAAPTHFSFGSDAFTIQGDGDFMSNGEKSRLCD
jgi:hypothetical protein